MIRNKNTKLVDRLHWDYKDMWESISWYEYSKDMCTHLEDFNDHELGVYFFGDFDATVEENLKYHNEIINEKHQEIEDFKCELIDKYKLNSSEIHFVLYGV